MGTLLGDALAKAGLVSQKKADEAARRLGTEREERRIKALIAEKKAREEKQPAENEPEEHWKDEEHPTA